MGKGKGMSRPYKCSHCGKDYAIDYMRERHVKQIHYDK